MARVEITSQRCPVCKYVYQVQEFFKVETIKKKIMTPNDNKEHINPKDYNPFNTCKYVTSIEKKEVLYDTKTIGDQQFIPLQIPSYTKSENGSVSGINVKSYGMFCPKCGVFLNTDICTSNEKKDIPD